jgi:hypothetical protein
VKLVDALAIRFHHLKGGGRRDCPAIVATYADSGRRPPPHAGASDKRTNRPPRVF